VFSLQNISCIWQIERDQSLVGIVFVIGDAAYLLRALLNCDEDQKKDLNNSYSNTHGQSLLEQISSSSTKYSWRPWIAFISELLLSSKHKSSMMYIKSLLDSDPISESKLVQVLCSHGDDDVQAILRCYEDDTGRSLVNEINCKFQAESAEALCAFLTKKVSSEWCVMLVNFTNKLLTHRQHGH